MNVTATELRERRHLAAADATPDLAPRPDAGDVPEDLARALDELGVG